MEKQVSEGSLHKWFKGSKSKDGKGGWVNVVTGGTCASDEPGEGTPKCVSSAKRASMTKAERLSAARRKKKADPGQQQKSGAAKPTYVSTDKPKKKKMKESYTRSLTPLTEKAKKCWPGYEKKGTKKMFGKTYNNCVKKEEVEMEAVNAAQQAAIAIAKKKKKEEDMVAMKKKKKNMYASYQPEKEMVDENVGKTIDKLGIKAVEYGAKKNIPGTGLLAKGLDFQRKLRTGTKGDGFIGDPSLNIKNPLASKPIIKDYPSRKEYQDSIKNKTSNQYSSYDPEGETISEVKDKKGKGSGKKDACYHKVKSRYSVWPSAYASGALVKCRKVGAANWGNSSKKEDFSDWKSEFIWEDGDSLKKLDEKKKIVKPLNPSDEDMDKGIAKNIHGLGVKKIDKKVKEIFDEENDELTKLRNALKTKTMNGKPLGPKELEGIKAAITQGGNELEEDWQKTNRQDKTDGMSQKAVNAYKRENPGSKLKTAVTKKPSSLKRGSKDAKRRKSFCSRMKGMKKRLTSAKTARDPDSRINKALRRWNC